MKLTTEQKAQLVMRYQNGKTITDICKETGVFTLGSNLIKPQLLKLVM